ncbi:MAG TPA: hypothetical protein VFW98_15085 [Gemmatimonadaceae bacterium]|nr:hypothetical protein [Gemmatimonadaceae bacterium]
MRTLATGCAAVLLAACTTVGPGSPITTPAPATGQPGAASSAWPIETREDVDLWLHSYAMISDDTTQVPFFKRGYREQMLAFKRRANVRTKLDDNYDRLHDGLAQHPGYVSGQFLPLYFGSWQDMQRAISLFLEADGNPQRATDQQTQAIIATFASVFPTAADRAWLQTFTASVEDEDAQYYHDYWTARQRDLAPVRARVDSLWQNVYLAKLAPYLNNEQLDRGILYLSLPLDGEGRTITGRATTEQGNSRITVTFPQTPDAALDAIYVVAHEAIGRVANSAVQDNTTPAEQRSGATNHYTSAAAVRGGALLLKHVAPELVAGYARYYLSSANAAFTGNDPEGALAQAFPLPQPILTGLDHQIALVLGGI